MHPTLARLESLFPGPGFQVAATPIVSDVTDLHPAERALLARAVPQRLAAYAAGRRCARRALQQLDHVHGLRLADPGAPLLRDPHGSPCWPAHAVGSISHSPSKAVAVAAQRTHARAIGVDIESLERDIGLDTLARVFAEAETRWLAQQPAADRTRLAYAVFSAREALYKCVYQACGHRLSPSDVELQLDVSRGLFLAQWRGPAQALRLPPLTGRFGFDAGQVLAGVACPAQPLLPALPTHSTAPESLHEPATP